jgi:ribonuclease P protein component
LFAIAARAVDADSAFDVFPGAKGAAMSDRSPAAGLHRFPASRRVTRSSDFERLLRDGERRAQSGYMVYFQRRERGPARLGLLVTRRHSRHAVERNRLKRCVREAFRHEQARMGAIDVLVRPPYGASAGAEMIATVRKLLVRISA